VAEKIIHPPLNFARFDVHKEWPDEDCMEIIEKGPRSFVATYNGVVPVAERGIELP
jgi:hypothetical protein